MKQRVVALVSGHVQGVNYRNYARGKARELGIQGSAENLLDGRVEVVAEGEAEDLAAFLEFLRRGPRLARVIDLEVSYSEPTGLDGFSILR